MLDRGRDRGGDLVDLADDAADRLDGIDGLAGDLLDVGNLLGNILGGLGGLARQRLDLGGDHGKAATGFTGAGGLDGRVQRQKVGLGGDGVDQADHFTDPARGLRQALHGAVGFPRLADGAACDACGMGGLTADIVDRGAQLLRRRGDALDAHRGFAGGLLGNLNPRIGLAGDGRQAGRGGPHLAGSVAQFLQGLAHHALEFTDIAFDRLLARGGAGIAFALLLLDPCLVLGLLLEGFQSASQRADLVAALLVSGVDREISGRHFQHGVAHVVQRCDDAAGDRHHGAEGQGQCGRQQRKLQHQRAQRRGVLHRGMGLGCIEGGLRDLDRAGQASHGDRAPLVRRQFGLLARDQRGQQALAQGKIVRLEIGDLGRRHGAGKHRRQLHSRSRQFERVPCGVGAADEFRIVHANLRRHASGGEPFRNDQRSLAGGVAQQPGGLLDRQQLVDRGVLMVDGGGEGCGQFVEGHKQCRGGVEVFLGQRRATRGLRLADVVPEFLLLSGQGLEQTVQFGHQRLLLGEFNAAEFDQRARHRRHFGVAKTAQIRIDLAVHPGFGIEQPDGGGLIGAQIMHRLEQVRRSVGDHRDAVRRLQSSPGIPGVERESDHDAKGGGQDNCFQQRGYGQTIEHNIPPGSLHLG